MGYTQASRCSKTTVVTVLIISLFNTLTYGIYLNKFVVRTNDVRNVDRLAAKYGMKNLGQVGNLKDYFAFEAPHVRKRSIGPSDLHLHSLLRDPNVKWVEQQVAKTRVKRDITPNDPYWRHQWYLDNGGKKGFDGAVEFDMGVKAAWRSGYTGKGIVVTVLDDGIERDHPDLVQNYDAKASYDINSGDSDPMPRYDFSNENRHGTRCAGEIAAKANNSNCIIGAAYNAGIGGIRMLDGTVDDHVEASSLGYHHDYVDIYSSSWGPDDDGRTVDGPGKITKAVFKEGVSSGRNGKGNIFMWASGNGGSRDSCSCDGYTNSLYTISIGSVSQYGSKPWYLEECSSTMAVTYSSGSSQERKIVTTDLRKGCTMSHTGTSASAPLAAGLVALTLEANPSLTWRDVQHITMLSASMEPIIDSSWTKNGVNRKVSLKYGYGLMNATTMVNLAEKWITVPAMQICTKHGAQTNVPLFEHRPFEEEIAQTGCQGEANEVNYLENVHVTVSLNYQSRGKISLYLVSPSGTRCTLLPKRPYDYHSSSFTDWEFLSVHFWGENPSGTWKFSIVDKPYQQVNESSKGKLTKWKITFYGTKSKPFYVNEESTTLKPTSLIPDQKTTPQEAVTVKNTTYQSTVTSTDQSDIDHTTDQAMGTSTETKDSSMMTTPVTGGSTTLQTQGGRPIGGNTNFIIGMMLGVISIVVTVCFVVYVLLRKRRLGTGISGKTTMRNTGSNDVFFVRLQDGE